MSSGQRRVEDCPYLGLCFVCTYFTIRRQLALDLFTVIVGFLLFSFYLLKVRCIA